jgi:chemotaxis protein CheC
MIPKYKVGNIGQLLLSSWSKNYSSALMGSIELSRQRELGFWFQFNTLDPLLQHSQKLSDYF